MLGDVNKLFVFKSLMAMPSTVLPLHLKQTFPPIIWIFTEDEGIKSRLPFYFTKFKIGPLWYIIFRQREYRWPFQNVLFNVPYSTYLFQNDLFNMIFSKRLIQNGVLKMLLLKSNLDNIIFWKDICNLRNPFQSS